MTRPVPWDLLRTVERRYDSFGNVPADITAFTRLPAAQRLLAEVESPDLVEREPAAAAEYFHLLFADWQHWRHDRPVRAVNAAELATLLAGAPPAAPRLSAVYLQFPPRIVWMRPTAGPHEPVDGCYVVPAGRDELLVVTVLGLHAGREGFSQVTVTARHDDLTAAEQALPADRFAPAMEGGARAGMHSIRSAAELLHLVRLALGGRRA